MIGAGVGRLGEVFSPDSSACLSVVLFDEIEKAHPVLWNTLLGILEGGVVTLGDNSTTRFAQSIVILTSNVGSRQMDELMERTPIGFVAPGPGSRPRTENLEAAALLAARQMFPLEFLNRMDETLVYRTLGPRQLDAIFDKFLEDLHQRMVHQATYPLLVKVQSEARRFVVSRGTDPALGARPLRRAMDTELVAPLSRLIAAGLVKRGDTVLVEREGDGLAFYRDEAPRRAIVA
jgi:ATP-dependent Clp protease ATP-binding subunit ClpC